MERVVLACILLLGFANCGSGEQNKKETNQQDVVIGLEIGNKAPELVFNSPNGNSLALSSLKGKMVLIDFWASWCPPCRRENPNVVNAYNKFKNSEFKNGDGFTVYGVSFDNNKDQWLAAIESDGLVWETHVSDLKGWSSEAAQIYQIEGIPTNYLINGDGIIVASNLREEGLHEALKKALK